MAAPKHANTTTASRLAAHASRRRRLDKLAVELEHHGARVDLPHSYVRTPDHTHHIEIHYHQGDRWIVDRDGRAGQNIWYTRTGAVFTVAALYKIGIAARVAEPR